LEESSDLKVEKNKKASEDNNRAPKPNKKLLDKLKEEMRKLKKPAVSPKPSEEGLKDTLLTIPPLILGDQVQSMNFLKTPDVKSDAQANGKCDDQDDGKILFTTNDQEVSQSIGSRKRKLDKRGDWNEEEFDGDNTSNSSKDGEDLDESDVEDEGEIKSSDSD